MKNFKYIWLVGLVATLAIIIVPLAIFLPGQSQAVDDPWASVPQRKAYVDHSSLMPGPYESGSEVTQACLECHDEAALEVMDTVHWTWESEPYVVEERFTLMDWLNLPTGVVVLLMILMALFMFWGAEHLERIFGGKNLNAEHRRRFIGAGALLVGALLVFAIGQPTNTDRWENISPEKQTLLEERRVQIHPGELLATMHDHTLNLVLLDVRQEADYNLFHIADARLVKPQDWEGLVSELHLLPANTVVVVMSNDERGATEAWKFLVAEAVPNAYILEGGVNNWIATFAVDEPRIHPLAIAEVDQLRYKFAAALGAAYPAAEPHA